MKTRNRLIFALLTIIVFAGSNTFGQNDIMGIVIYNNSEETPLEGVMVHLYDMEDVLIENTFSDATGKFTFSDMESGTYQIKATSAQDPLSVIDLLDVSLFIDYLNGLIELDPLQEEAANVDGNGEADAEDLEFLTENWYLLGENFPAGDWIFEENIVSVGGKDGQTTVNGSCVADISSDFEPDKNTGMQMASLNVVDVQSFSTLELPVKTDFQKKIKNFFVEIAYDENELYNVSIQANLPGIKYSIKDGLMKIIWADLEGKGVLLNDYNKLFTITAQTGNITLVGEDNLRLTANCSFVTGQNEFTTEIALYIPEANILTSGHTDFTNFPNPAGTSTTFSYFLENEGNVSIELINTHGAVLQTILPGQQDKGINQFEVRTIDLPSGYYIARLILNRDIIANKKIIIK